MKKLGISAAREATEKKVLDLKFEPKGDTSLNKPKYGKEDPNNEAHTGGNTWAGGVRHFHSPKCFSRLIRIRLEDATLLVSGGGVATCACSKATTLIRQVLAGSIWRFPAELVPGVRRSQE